MIILSALICFIWLFPYEDLSGLVTETVAKQTNNQVFISFDDLNLSLFPNIGLDMENVKLDIQNLPTIEVKAMSFSPSVSSLISKKIGFSSSFQGLLDGDIKLSIKPTGETENKTPIHNVRLEAENIQLSELKQFIKLPLNIKSRANLDINADVDYKFDQQPDGELSLVTQKLKLPATVFPTAMGEMPFPEMTFDKFLLNGRITAGELIIEQLELGSEKDPLSLRLKGSMALKLLNTPQGLQPLPGSYKFKLEVNNKASDIKELQILWTLLDRYKVSSNQGDQYLLRVEGARFGVPPEMSKLNKYD
ncbi:MAG: type II secretion system protein GspN [Bdellovibrionales bacterium]|nr:type II secretion system protein GspN [Bdellovibrionales bacterium]